MKLKKKESILELIFAEPEIGLNMLITYNLQIEDILSPNINLETYHYSYKGLKDVNKVFYGHDGTKQYVSLMEQLNKTPLCKITDEHIECSYLTGEGPPGFIYQKQPFATTSSRRFIVSFTPFNLILSVLKYGYKKIKNENTDF